MNKTSIAAAWIGGMLSKMDCTVAENAGLAGIDHEPCLARGRTVPVSHRNPNGFGLRNIRAAAQVFERLDSPSLH